MSTTTGPAPDARAHVVRTFMPAGVLLDMPGKLTKRRLLMEHVADRFEPGVRYPEAADQILMLLTAGGGSDHVTVRRYLVDFGLLARDSGEYWRTGGWVSGT
ncbi:MAG: DUF2087 domain-containing protein [Oryzihumus sp.]